MQSCCKSIRSNIFLFKMLSHVTRNIIRQGRGKKNQTMVWETTKKYNYKKRNLHIKNTVLYYKHKHFKELLAGKKITLKKWKLMYIANYKLHLPSTSIRIKSWAAAAADLQHPHERSAGWRSRMRRLETRPFAATWMDRECHTEWSKSDREGEISYDIPYVRNLNRNDTNEHTYKTETHRLTEQTYGCSGEGTVQDFGKVMCTLLYLKWMTNKNLLYKAHGTPLNVVTAWMAEGFGEEWKHVYVWLSSFTVHLKLSHC